MDKKVENQLKKIQAEILDKWPRIEQTWPQEEAKNPNFWEDMLSECDLMFHEDRRNAVANDRLHSDEILEIEHAIEDWGKTPKLKRFTILRFLIVLRKHHQSDRSIDATLHAVEAHCNELPPTPKD